MTQVAGDHIDRNARLQGFTGRGVTQPVRCGVLQALDDFGLVCLGFGQGPLPGSGKKSFVRSVNETL